MTEKTIKCPMCAAKFTEDGKVIKDGEPAPAVPPKEKSKKPAESKKMEKSKKPAHNPEPRGTSEEISIFDRPFK